MNTNETQIENVDGPGVKDTLLEDLLFMVAANLRSLSQHYGFHLLFDTIPCEQEIARVTGRPWKSIQVGGI